MIPLLRLYGVAEHEKPEYNRPLWDTVRQSQGRFNSLHRS
jgi:hypothetical protein